MKIEEFKKAVEQITLEKRYCYVIVDIETYPPTKITDMLREWDIDINYTQAVPPCSVVIHMAHNMYVQSWKRTASLFSREYINGKAIIRDSALLRITDKDLEEDNHG